MRYAHIVRKHEVSPSPPAYALKSQSKVVKYVATLALDFRHLLRSLSGPRTVRGLIALPFVLALVLALVRPTHLLPQAVVPDGMADGMADGMPHEFQKFGYDAIREGTERPADSRFKVSLKGYFRMLAKRRKVKLDPEKSVSVVAACRDRRESLMVSLTSWVEVQGVDEVVLVDWGSQDELWQEMPLLDSLVKSGKMTFVRVTGVDEWVLSRAYNLAIGLATGRFIIKVDCDTHLEPDFLHAHPRPEKGKYYTLGEGAAADEDQEKLQGVWFARKLDFVKVGGYDERIIDYGYENLDLYKRFDSMRGLEVRFLELGKVRHNSAHHVLWPRSENNNQTHRISERMNRALMRNLTPWPQVRAKGAINQYGLWFSRKTFTLTAKLLDEAPTAESAKSPEQLETIRADVLRTAMHDDYNIPWDIIPYLSHADLEFLSAHMDSARDPHIIVVSLEGGDALSNIFNLVSALQLGMSLGRPVVSVWNFPSEVEVDQSGGSVLDQLFDIEATNELLAQASTTAVAQKYAFPGASRLIGAKRWPCVEELSVCAAKYDSVYSTFLEVPTHTPRFYDESDAPPLSIRLNGFIRLSNKTVIGNEETRAMVFKSLVPSHLVREAQADFGVRPPLGVVAEMRGNPEGLVKDVRSKYPTVVSAEGGAMVPIVGPAQHNLRRVLVGEDTEIGYCEAGTCTVPQIAKEVANVLAICGAEEVFPSVDAADKESWVLRHDKASMMLADLRALNLNY